MADSKETMAVCVLHEHLLAILPSLRAISVAMSCTLCGLLLYIVIACARITFGRPPSKMHNCDACRAQKRLQGDDRVAPKTHA